MNIKLVYKESNFKIDVMEDTPCQYLYSVAQKVFRKKSSDIVLFYGKTELENNSQLIFDVMGKDDKEDILDEEIIIVRLKKDLMNEYGSKYKVKPVKLNNNNDNNLNNSDKQLPRILKSSATVDNKFLKKKLPIKCQICSHKNSIFYCRNCNMFICFECNIRYIEHHKHKRINLEDGDTKLGMETYKEKILNELRLIDLGYQKYSKWILSNVDRDNYLQTTFKLLEKIKKNSQRLSDIKTLYNLDQDQIKNVDLQIIKTEYNKVLVNCISDAQKCLNRIIEDVENKLHECEDMKFWGIAEVKLYLKNNKNEQEDNNIFNFAERAKNNINLNENEIKDSSQFLSESEEDLKKYKSLYKNKESSDIKEGGILQDKKKEENNNSKQKKKKRVSIIIDEDSDEEKNISNQKYDKNVNIKNSSSFPTIGLNKTVQEKNNKEEKGNDVIMNIISNFDDENNHSDYMSPNKRSTSIQYPIIMNKLKTVTNNTINTNANINTNDEINNKKYIQNDFKNFKAEKKYGKKLINVLRRRNDNKKD